MKEDWNALAADCVVISCCCQCLVLQIVVFILLKLPYRLIRKTRDYAKKKLRGRKGKEKLVGMVKGGPVRIQVAGTAVGKNEGHVCGNCMEEVEKVLEELSRKGEFAFGSFWDGEESESFHTYVAAKQGFDSNVVEFKLIEIPAPLRYS